MAKKGVSKVSGNISPVVGVKQVYHIAEWYPNTPTDVRNPTQVTWELFKKRSNGKFTTTNIKKKGISEFTFGETAWKHTYRLEAYLYEPEGGGLTINPKPSKIPKINKVELHYVDDSKGSTFSFMEKLRAKAHCVNLTGKELLFTLWEDDAKGAGHNAQNQAIDTQKAKVGNNGVVAVDFMLTKALMQKAMKGEADTKQLEFYVTVEYYQNKKHATENENINNPFPQQQKPKPPASKPSTPSKPKTTPKAKDSPAAQKPPSKKEEKGIMESISEKWDELWDWAESKGTTTKEKPPTRNVDNTNKPVVVDVTDGRKEETECFCKKKENQFYWSNKLTCEGRKKVLQVCANLWGEKDKTQKASELMAIIHVETAATFNPAIDNGAGYSGLIQFSDASAKRVGTTRAKLKAMTFVEQMDYVEKYLNDKKDQLNTMTDLYLMVLKTNAVGQGSNPNYILFDESISVPNVPFDKNNLTKEPWVTKYGYASNPTYMVEKGEFANKRQFKTYSKGTKEKRGFAGGKTYVWEVTDVLTKKHYNLGKPEVFNGKCENIKEEKKKSDGKYPPWIDIAIAEEKKIIRESTHCQYIIDVYEASTDNYKLTKCTGSRSEAAWCATFVNYCLETSGHQSQQDPGAIWYKTVNRVKRGKNGPYETTEIWAKKHSTMYMGGVVVWANNGHTTFVVGIDKSNPDNYLYLGGNQDDGVRFWSMPKTKVHPFCLIPIDYTGDLIPLEELEPSDLSSGAIKYKEGGKTT